MARKPVRKWLAVAAWITGGGALVGVVFVLSFYVAMKQEMRATQVSVPDLTGLTEEEGGKVAAPLGLVLEVADRRHDPRVSSGKVLEQVPRPGASVRRGRKIRLVVSLGGRVLEVPDLLGKASREVTLELRRQGLLPGDEAGVYSRSAQAGTILAQVPAPGSPAVPGSRVHRLVSLGPPVARWVMPNLEGRSRVEAERWVKTAGFRLGPPRRIRTAGLLPGIVVGQHPLPGYPVRTHDVVELTVSQ